MAQAVRRDPASIGTTCAFGKIGHCNAQHLKKGKPATNARQEKALGFRQTPGGELGSQFQDAVYQSKAFGIKGHQAFAVHFSEGYMQRPLFGSDVPHTVQCQVDAFSDPDTGDSHQEQRIGVHIVGTTQFRLQASIVFGG
jgi:hypothetical protein